MQKISKEILLVTPNSVKIMGDFKTELLSGGDFGFLGKEFYSGCNIKYFNKYARRTDKYIVFSESDYVLVCKTRQQ